MLRWRGQYRDDGATRFGEVASGLNQMTLRRFERLVQRSRFRFASFEALPIRALRLFHNSLTREFFMSMVCCQLVRK